MVSHPVAGHTGDVTSQTPIEITTLFLDALARGESGAALPYAAPDIEYTNVGLPTFRGREWVGRIFGSLERFRIGFNYQMINVAADGGIVLTERVDEIKFGPVALQFWVCGRYEVQNAQITVWRDYFDFLDIGKALVKGVVAAVIPAVQRPLPAPTPAVG